MRSAKFIWVDHPKQPEVTIDWQLHRDKNEYELLSLSINSDNLTKRNFFKYDGTLDYLGSKTDLVTFWDDLDLYVSCEGLSYHFRYKPSYLELMEAEQGSGQILAVMPGKILKINVSPGQIVQTGDSLLIMESMKMENKVLAPRDGEVSEVLIIEGELVEAQQKLITIVGADE